MPEDATFKESYLVNGVLIIITALLIWVGSTVNDNQIAIASIQVSMNNIQESMKSAMSNRFTSVEGRAMEKDINRLELRLNEHVQSAATHYYKYQQQSMQGKP